MARVVSLSRREFIGCVFCVALTTLTLVGFADDFGQLGNGARSSTTPVRVVGIP